MLSVVVKFCFCYSYTSTQTFAVLTLKFMVRALITDAFMVKTKFYQIYINLFWKLYHLKSRKNINLQFGYFMIAGFFVGISVFIINKYYIERNVCLSNCIFESPFITIFFSFLLGLWDFFPASLKWMCIHYSPPKNAHIQRTLIERIKVIKQRILTNFCIIFERNDVCSGILRIIQFFSTFINKINHEMPC